MAVSKKIRFEVFKRDSFTCQYCGRSAPDIVLNLDHVHPRSGGGTDDITNLVTACYACNAGKSDRLLSDDSVLQKRKAQLDLLQERREQLEMMMEWQRGLTTLEDDALSQLADYWRDLSGFNLNEYGLNSLRKWMEKFSIPQVAEAMRASISGYAEPSGDGGFLRESIDTAFNKIPGVATVNKQCKDRPYMKGLYYIRGILRKRLSYMNEGYCLSLLKEAAERGVSVESLREFSLGVSTWTRFKTEIYDLPTEEAGGEM